MIPQAQRQKRILKQKLRTASNFTYNLLRRMMALGATLYILKVVTDYRTLRITLFHQCITYVLCTQYCCITYVTPTYQSPLLSYCIPLPHVYIPLHFHSFTIKSLMQFHTLQKLTKVAISRPFLRYMRISGSMIHLMLFELLASTYKQSPVFIVSTPGGHQ